jgi:glycosyltransferase involved in cell wall biosynthesis
LNKKLLRSWRKIPPQKIIAYIPNGYNIPQFPNSEQIEWVRSPKGMVTQRSLSFEEVTTDWILFLDDDVYLPTDGVEKLFEGISQYDGDAITFANRKKSKGTIIKRIFAGVRPHRSNVWGIIVRKGGRFSYNIAPPRSVMRTQSGYGPCGLVKKSVYQAIHFEDERWQESISGYCLGDDQLFYNKMHLMGYKVLVHYDSGITHLDASSTCKKADRLVYQKNVAQLFLVWHRSSYHVASRYFDKISRVAAYFGIQLLTLMIGVVKSVCSLKFYQVTDHIRGIIDGYKFTKTEQYKNLPPFIEKAK